eukprot:5879037-Prymnesium_polylepis.1
MTRAGAWQSLRGSRPRDCTDRYRWQRALAPSQSHPFGTPGRTSVVRAPNLGSRNPDRRSTGAPGNLLPDTQDGTVPHRDRPAHVP